MSNTNEQMKLLSKIFCSYGFWAISAVAIIYLTVYGIIADNYKRAPPDRYYYGLVDYAIDASGVLTTIREGHLGHWRSFVKISTTIPEQYSFVRAEYILLGQTGRLFRLDPLVMYHLSKILASVLLISLILVLISRIFSKLPERLAALVLIFFGSGFVWPGNNYMLGIFEVVPKETVPLIRVTLASYHVMLGSLFCLITLLAFYEFQMSYRFKYLVIAVITGWAAGMLYLPVIALGLFGLAVYIIYRATGRILFKEKTDRRFLPAVIIYIILMILPALYLLFINSFVKNNVLNTENLVPFHAYPPFYFIMTGIPYLLAVGGAVRAWREGEKTIFLFLAGWVIAHPVGVYILSPLLGINRVRLFYTPYHVVYGVLGAYLLSGIRNLKYKIPALIITAIIGIAAVIGSIPVYRLGLGHYRVCYCLGMNNDFGYPPRSMMEGIWWLRENTHEDDIVLTGEYAGMLVPAFSGNRVYNSWWFKLLGTPNFYQVTGLANDFYAGNMTGEDAYRFVTDNRIRYVLWGEMLGLESTVLPYGFLRKEYRSGYVTIYRVK